MTVFCARHPKCLYLLFILYFYYFLIGSQFGSQFGGATVNRHREQFNRLLEAINGKTTVDLADALGVRPQSVAGAIKRKSIPPSWFVTICDQYGVSSDWLIYGKGNKYFDNQKPDLKQKTKDVSDSIISEAAPEISISVPKHDAPESGDFIYVPLAELHLETKGDLVVLSENVLKYHAFRSEWIKGVASAGHNMVLVWMRGNSMHPTLQDGDLVMIDLGRTRVYDGLLYAVGIGTTVLIKRLKLKPDTIRICSDNDPSADYDARPADFRIIGPRCLAVPRSHQLGGMMIGAIISFLVAVFFIIVAINVLIYLKEIRNRLDKLIDMNNISDNYFKRK